MLSEKGRYFLLLLAFDLPLLGTSYPVRVHLRGRDGQRGQAARKGLGTRLQASELNLTNYLHFCREKS